MLTLKQIYDNKEAIIAGLEKKHFEGAAAAIEQVIALDSDRKAAQQKKDNASAEMNRLSKQIGGLMKEGKREEAEAAKAATAALKENIREYEEAIQDLLNLGLIRKLPRIKSADLPLENNIDMKSFEIFCIDHGLLRSIYNLPVSRELTLEDIFNECSGGVAEQYVFEELSAKVGYLYYWVSGATARVPFVYESAQGAIPVDLRFVKNNKAQNIKTFCAKNPDTNITLKISLEPIAINETTLNVPAYGLWNM